MRNTAPYRVRPAVVALVLTVFATLLGAPRHAWAQG